MNRLGILAKKIGMTQLFLEDGSVVPVTVLEAGPCTVVQKKDVQKDGYSAIQIGFLQAKEARLNKPKLGHFKKRGLSPKKVLEEIRLDDAGSFEVGQDIFADIFTPNDFVDVTGISIGKGFQGVVKRHNFSGLKNTHGARWKRHMGSAGAGTDPANIIKGKKMPGRTGGCRITTQSIKVVLVNKEKNLVYVRGAVPGKTKNVVLLRHAIKKPAAEAGK